VTGLHGSVGPANDALAPALHAPAAFPAHRGLRTFWRAENVLATAALVAMTALPVLESASRQFVGTSIPGSLPAVQYLTLILTFLGAALAARAGKHLAVEIAHFFSAAWQRRAAVIAAAATVAVTATLTVASIQLIAVDYRFGAPAVWGLPVWAVSTVMPLALTVITGRVIWHAAPDWRGRALAALGLLVPALLAPFPPHSAVLAWPLGIALLVATALGMPIFAALGGAALLFVWFDATPIANVPGEAFRLSTSPLLPAIPLFTFAGFFLSAGGANRRLLAFFTALTGWMPGGLAIVTTVVLAFFTPLTGASGVTILAMGGLLLPMMLEARYPERTSVGLITVSGSIGVFFPPSLPVILYAFYAELPIDRLFIAGVVPGILLVGAVAAWAAARGWWRGATRTPFSLRALGRTAWVAKWELALPVVIVGAIFAGYATLVEAAALTVAYALFVELAIFRELSPTRDLPAVAVESATLVGGFMIILGVALGLTNDLILAELPMKLLAWLKEAIRSPQVFLLALNVFLIIVGALMDIYSAIIVVVPLLVPLAAAYGLDPTHVGIVFLANMQLGYLMPPMGENLFLAAYRFNRSLPELYVATLPYVVILLAVVLVITYFPPLTLWLVGALG